jgi:hypothetical protein
VVAALWCCLNGSGLGLRDRVGGQRRHCQRVGGPRMVLWRCVKHAAGMDDLHLHLHLLLECGAQERTWGETSKF